VLKGKRFSDVEDIKLKSKLSHLWKKKFDTILFRIVKSVLSDGRSTGNFVKNWREITLKKIWVLICAALKINLNKLVSKLICLTLYITSIIWRLSVLVFCVHA
jgi:hypothetical protein